MDQEELNCIVDASRYVHGNTKLGQPGWIWKNRQLGFERYRAGMLFEHMNELMFGPKGMQQQLFDLALKIIEGRTDFTNDELQLQANESEGLEKMLRELIELLPDDNLN